MKFNEDITLPPAVKVEQVPQPIVAQPLEVTQAHEVDEPQPQASTQPHPSCFTKGTVRKDADGSTGYVDPYGRVVHQRPKVAPVKAVPAPVQFDPHTKYPSSGESRCVYRYENGVVTNMSTGEREDGQIVSRFGGIGGELVHGMSTRKLS